MCRRCYCKMTCTYMSRPRKYTTVNNGDVKYRWYRYLVSKEVSIPKIGIAIRYRKVSIPKLGIEIRCQKVSIPGTGIEIGHRKVSIPKFVF